MLIVERFFYIKNFLISWCRFAVAQKDLEFLQNQPTSDRFAVLQLQGLLHLLMSFGVVAFHHDLIIITIAVVQRTPFDAF